MDGRMDGWIRVHRGTNYACAGTQCFQSEVSRVEVHACINMGPLRLYVVIDVNPPPPPPRLRFSGTVVCI
jgi:hypothetical protein